MSKNNTKSPREILKTTLPFLEAEEETIRCLLERLGSHVLEQLADHELLDTWLLNEFESEGHIPDRVVLTLEKRDWFPPKAAEHGNIEKIDGFPF